MLINKLKIVTTIAIASVSVGLYSNASAASPKDGLGVSAMYSSGAAGIGLIYNNAVFISGIYVEYDKFKSDDKVTVHGNYSRGGATGNEWGVGGYVGLKMPVSNNNLFLTGGINGGYAQVKVNGNDTDVGKYNEKVKSYGVGIFIGADYYLTDQFFISFKINPISYDKATTSGNIVNGSAHDYSIFNDGAISVNYTF